MKCVLDASALLAAINGEPGGERVDDVIEMALISAVNYSEVMAGLIKFGNSEADARQILATLGCTVMAADEELAIDAGLMRASTDRAGLSLADRFCLALARRVGAMVLTSDRQWSEIADAVGVRVQQIR